MREPSWCGLGRSGDLAVPDWRSAAGADGAGPAVVYFVQIATSSENLELNMEQVRIADGAPLSGRTLLDSNLRQRFGVIVVGIQRANGRMEFNPAPDAEMRAGDHLVVLGRSENLRELEAAAGQSSARLQ